ncbi:hypothetical protein BU17DRAFT_44976 [Hysterangium stoloniferum]|nr:hypothetical protein BU17DRAFT_44976 [Hysterangium stoloniferum]
MLNQQDNNYKFDVKMTCSGCSGAVTRVLQRLQDQDEGVTSYEVNLEKQEVLVKGSIDYETLLEKIKKTGKEVGETTPNCERTLTNISLRFGLERC